MEQGKKFFWGLSPIAVFTILFWIFPQSEILNFVKEKDWRFWLFVFLIYLIGYYLGFQNNKNSNGSTNKMDLNNYINHSIDQKRYSVVLVDDMFKNQSTLNLYRDRFTNYNICFLPSVSDIKMLVGFDIIILDIMGTGYRMGNKGNFGDVNAYLQELFREYPYKYIVAASTNIGRLNQSDIVDNSYYRIPKVVNTTDNSGKIDDEYFINSIKNALLEAFNLLDDPSKFWNDISRKISNSDNKNRVKRNYAYSLSIKGSHG